MYRKLMVLLCFVAMVGCTPREDKELLSTINQLEKEKQEAIATCDVLHDENINNRSYIETLKEQNNNLTKCINQLEKELREDIPVQEIGEEIYWKDIKQGQYINGQRIVDISSTKDTLVIQADNYFVAEGEIFYGELGGMTFVGKNTSRTQHADTVIKGEGFTSTLPLDFSISDEMIEEFLGKELTRHMQNDFYLRLQATAVFKNYYEDLREAACIIKTGDLIEILDYTIIQVGEEDKELNGEKGLTGRWHLKDDDFFIMDIKPNELVYSNEKGEELERYNFEMIDYEDIQGESRMTIEYVEDERVTILECSLRDGELRTTTLGDDERVWVHTKGAFNRKESLANVYLDYSEGQVLEAIGYPIKRSHGENLAVGGTYVNYVYDGLEVNFLDNRVTSVRVNSSAYEGIRGVRVGDYIEDIKENFPSEGLELKPDAVFYEGLPIDKPSIDYDKESNTYTISYCEQWGLFLTFQVKDNKIISISTLRHTT